MNLQKISENRPTIRKLLNENQRQKVLISHLETENNWLREQLATIANQGAEPEKSILSKWLSNRKTPG